MPQTKAQVYKFLFDWLKAESGMTVIKANQKGPRPARPYVSLNFLNPSTRSGSSVDQYSMTDTTNPDNTHTYTVATEGLRKAVASINVFGENAVDTLAKIRDSLDRPDVIESFAIAEIGHVEESQINDLTALQETIYEERGQMDLTVSYVAGSEVDVGTIDKVQLNGSAGGISAPLTVQ